MQLVEDLDLSLFRQYTVGSKLLQFCNSPSVTRYSSEIPSLSLFSLIELHLFVRKVG